MEDWEQRIAALNARLVAWNQAFEAELARVCKERKLRGWFRKPTAPELDAAAIEARRRAGVEVLAEAAELFDALCGVYAQALPQERAKIRARRVTGNDTQQQREIARAIRVAREMALLPYSVRQVTHRSKGRRGERGDREGGERGERGDRDGGAPETEATGADEEACAAALAASSGSVFGAAAPSARSHVDAGAGWTAQSGEPCMQP